MAPGLGSWLGQSEQISRRVKVKVDLYESSQGLRVIMARVL